MAFTAITKDTNWLDRINTELNKGYGVTGSKQATGITSLNGFTVSDTAYRVARFGNLKLLTIYGSVGGKTLNAKLVSQVFQIPKSVCTGDWITTLGSIHWDGGGNFITSNIDTSTGSVGITNYGAISADLRFDVTFTLFLWEEQ